MRLIAPPHDDGFLNLPPGGRDWNRYYTLYQIAMLGSCYAASKHLRLKGISAVRRRIRTLEEALNMTLIETDPNGTCLTSEGRRLFVRIRHNFDPKP